MHTNVVVEKQEGTTLLKRSKFVLVYNIKMRLNKVGVRVWAGLELLGMEYNDNLFYRRQLNFRSLKIFPY
jgi:hypothetical protein